MIEVYSPFGIWHVFQYSINANKNENENTYHIRSITMKYGKCSKISNTLKLRTPKIIAENNF